MSYFRVARADKAVAAYWQFEQTVPDGVAEILDEHWHLDNVYNLLLTLGHLWCCGSRFPGPASGR